MAGFIECGDKCTPRCILPYVKMTFLPTESSRRSRRGLHGLTGALLVLSAWSGGLGAQARTTYDDPLASEADSLIAVLLSKRGGIGYGDSGVYAFVTDRGLLKRITRLEGHAMPPLVDCLGDTLPSMTYFDRARPLLRGAVCAQIAEAIDFFRAQPSAQVPRVSSTATAEDLRRAQPAWRTYFDAYAAHRAALLARLDALSSEKRAQVLTPSRPRFDSLPLAAAVPPHPRASGAGGGLCLDCHGWTLEHGLTYVIKDADARVLGVVAASGTSADAARLMGLIDPAMIDSLRIVRDTAVVARRGSSLDNAVVIVTLSPSGSEAWRRATPAAAIRKP